MLHLERTMSSEERIRRAEEIYQRRRNRQGSSISNSGVRVPTTHVNTKTKTSYSLFKKLILQILICLLVYFIFYLIKNSNYLFSEEVIQKTKDFLSYDMQFETIYQSGIQYYNEHIKGFIENLGKEENGQDDTNVLTNEQTNEVINEQTNTQTNEQEGGIGGGEEGQVLVNEAVTTSSDEQTQEPLSQMQIDANEIKANYHFILPLKGTITSHYGARTPTAIVSANHAGIDIGVNAGTIFVAAMEGKVTMVSSEGDYGNHVYIQNGDVVTLYAHSQKIYVKEGETIQQGQQLGEVGSTGKATGPHLHFEVRKSGRVVDPEYILSFS